MQRSHATARVQTDSTPALLFAAVQLPALLLGTHST
jgi:hypothetical protein